VWGDDVAIPLFELVVFLSLSQDIRMERLHRREHARFGARILPTLPAPPCVATLQETR
jgi:hypothetical protein